VDAWQGTSVLVDVAVARDERSGAAESVAAPTPDERAAAAEGVAAEGVAAEGVAAEGVAAPALDERARAAATAAAQPLAAAVPALPAAPVKDAAAREPSRVSKQRAAGTNAVHAQSERRGDAPARASSSERAPTNDDSALPNSGSYGAQGLPQGVRRLGYAFTRAIPAAGPAERAWLELPSGEVGTIGIELRVDEAGQLGAAKRWKVRPNGPAPPVELERLVERTLLLLRGGQFALSGSNQPGTERLLIEVVLHDDAATDEAAGSNVVEKSFEGARPGQPGRAGFRYGTGRRFEARVTIAD
jgi:hypothetical protein